jgi:hypothetical protein
MEFPASRCAKTIGLSVPTDLRGSWAKEKACTTGMIRSRNCQKARVTAKPPIGTSPHFSDLRTNQELSYRGRNRKGRLVKVGVSQLVFQSVKDIRQRMLGLVKHHVVRARYGHHDHESVPMILNFAAELRSFAFLAQVVGERTDT